MTYYKYLGYGVTNDQGRAKLDHNPNGTLINHSYVGRGIGAVNIIATPDTTITPESIVSADNILYDYRIYDDGHTGQASNKWWNWRDSPSTVVRSPDGAEYTSITPVNETGYYCFNFNNLNATKIIFDVYKTGGATSDILFQLRDNNMSVVCQYTLSSFTNLSLNTWYTVTFDLTEGTVTIGNQTLTYTTDSETQLCLRTVTSSETRYKELKIY